MDTITSPSNNKCKIQINKDICNAFGCSNNAVEKIDVDAGKFGIISLDLCINCIKKFQ
jgi:hypothetical protein